MDEELTVKNNGVPMERRWNEAWTAMMADEDWWAKEIDRQATHHILHDKIRSTTAGTDNPVAQNRDAHLATSSSTDLHIIPFTGPPPPKAAPGGGRPTVRGQARIVNGKFVTTDAGRAPCEKFQHNRCGATLGGNGCPDGPQFVHQCNINATCAYNRGMDLPARSARSLDSMLPTL